MLKNGEKVPHSWLQSIQCHSLLAYQVPYGILVWSTGIGPRPLLTHLQQVQKDKQGRIMTDNFCKVLGQEDVYSIGDCAVISGATHPSTGFFPFCVPCVSCPWWALPQKSYKSVAQVASQQGAYLAKAFNSGKTVQSYFLAHRCSCLGWRHWSFSIWLPWHDGLHWWIQEYVHLVLLFACGGLEVVFCAFLAQLPPIHLVRHVCGANDPAHSHTYPPQTQKSNRFPVTLPFSCWHINFL